MVVHSCQQSVEQCNTSFPPMASCFDPRPLIDSLFDADTTALFQFLGKVCAKHIAAPCVVRVSMAPVPKIV